MRKETQGEHKIWKTFHFFSLRNLVTSFPIMLPVKCSKTAKSHSFKFHHLSNPTLISQYRNVCWSQHICTLLY